MHGNGVGMGLITWQGTAMGINKRAGHGDKYRVVHAVMSMGLGLGVKSVEII